MVTELGEREVHERRIQGPGREEDEGWKWAKCNAKSGAAKLGTKWKCKKWYQGYDQGCQGI